LELAWIGNSFDGNLHHHGEIVFLGIPVVVVVALIWFLHRWKHFAKGITAATARGHSRVAWKFNREETHERS
jgi:hypothetical protein